MADKKEKRDWGEFRGTWPDPEEMICRNCRKRDKTIFVLNGVAKPVGVTKAFCEAYPPPPESNGKPSGILFYGDMCEYYEEE